MSAEIGAPLRREVRARARNRCEYCGMPDNEAVFPHEPDHIIAVKHGGPTVARNLAYACFDCNRAKGSDIASIDPATEALTALYSPRSQLWRDHFRSNGPVIEPITAVGRVTILLLKLNLPIRIAIRANLMHEGRYPSMGQD